MKISVSDEDIRNGRRNSRSECPVGLAIKRNGILHCCVTAAAVVVRDQHQRVTALLLPDPVRSWVEDFHQAKPVKPIHFELGLPVPAVCDGHCRSTERGSPACHRANGQHPTS